MTAPSFSSFPPPSFSSFPDLESGSGDTGLLDKPKKGKKQKKGSSSTEKDSKDRHKSERIKEAKTSLSHHADSRELHGKNLLFYSDTKGDSMNVQYGGLHAGDVPRYRMVAGGRNVLGLPKGLVVLRRVGKGVEVGPESHRKSASLSTSASKALLSIPPSRLLATSSGSRRYEEVDGFIAFPYKEKDDENPSYRSLSQTERKNPDDSTSSESELEYSSDGDNGPPVLSAHQETLKRLQQEVEIKPNSIETWLLLLNKTLSTIPITSKNARKARSEISLSVLSRALSSSPQNAQNKYLRLAYLRAGEEIWHESKLRSEWDNALKLRDIEIYLEWLEWTIRKGQGGVEGIVEAAVKILEKVDSDSDLDKIRIFWRVATSVKMAGFTERATAMFQAQAELSFNLPRGLRGMNFQTQLDELGEFWDSEYPRFGEDGAKGWDVWYSSKMEYEITSKPQSCTQPQLIDLDPYRQWAGQELELDRKMLLPVRSDTESLDPYSTVLFPDIRPILINISSSEAKHALRMSWLSFLGLKLPGFSLGAKRDSDWDDRWNLGYLTTPHSLDSIFPLDSGRNRLSTDSIAGVVIGREKEYNAAFGPVRCWGEDVCGPLDLACVHPGKILGRGLWSREDLMDIDENFVRQIFLQSKFHDDDDAEWNVMALAFETATNSKNAIKQSRTILSANQASLALWNSHAQLERLRGRPSDARKLYHTVLISAKAHKLSKNVGEMWWNWAEMEWLYGNDQQAIDVVLRAAGMEGPQSVVTILRAKRALEDVVESARSSKLWKDYVSWVKLRALLELLPGNELDGLLAVFDRYLSPRPNVYSEGLVTASLVMIYCHGTILKRRMAPSILRDRAHSAFEEYPSNSIILGILLEAERGQGVWGRIRNMLGGTDDKIKDVSRRVEEVWIAGWESGRWLSEVERTRNGLAAAVEHERTRFSWVIWRIYIEFEIRVKELQRAKKLLFRSIGECPLVKELYLVAFGPLRSVFQKHELNALADTMAERGIRLRQGLDEVVGNIGATEEGFEDEGGSGGEDEIEYNAKELRRLMPY